MPLSQSLHGYTTAYLNRWYKGQITRWVFQQNRILGLLNRKPIPAAFLKPHRDILFRSTFWTFARCSFPFLDTDFMYALNMYLGTPQPDEIVAKDPSMDHHNFRCPLEARKAKIDSLVADLDIVIGKKPFDIVYERKHEVEEVWTLERYHISRFHDAYKSLKDPESAQGLIVDEKGHVSITYTRWNSELTETFYVGTDYKGYAFHFDPKILVLRAFAKEIDNTVTPPVIRYKRPSPGKVPENYAQGFREQYKTRPILLREVNRRIAAGCVTRVENAGVDHDRLVLNPGRYKPVAEEKRKAELLRRKEVIRKMGQVMIDWCLEFTAVCRKNETLTKENVSRRFWKAHDEFVTSRDRYYNAVQEGGYKKEVPKSVPLPPRAKPHVKPSATQSAKSHFEFSYDSFCSYTHLFRMELYRFNAFWGRNPEGCDYVLECHVTKDNIKELELYTERMSKRKVTNNDEKLW